MKYYHELDQHLHAYDSPSLGPVWGWDLIQPAGHYDQQSVLDRPIKRTNRLIAEAVWLAVNGAEGYWLHARMASGWALRERAARGHSVQ